MSGGGAGTGPVRQDLIKTANLLFSQLDTSYVWSTCSKHFNLACQPGPEHSKPNPEQTKPNLDESKPNPDLSPVQPVGELSTNLPEMCALINFLLEIVSIETYVETSSEHLPKLFQRMTSSLRAGVRTLTGAELQAGLTSCKRVLGRVQPAWNVWDLNESLRKRGDSDVFDEARICTE